MERGEKVDLTMIKSVAPWLAGLAAPFLPGMMIFYFVHLSQALGRKQDQTASLVLKLEQSRFCS